jgi:L-ascorbate metabolism protein UlaG (beta-lactamase superfamily)
MYLTWLDNNSWFIEIGEQRILLDPWLVGSLIFGNFPWLFRGEHTHPQSIPAEFDLILLSQGLEDHAHPETLQQLDRQIPVVASPNAAKVVRQLGYTQVTALAHGETYSTEHLTIQAVPGSPIGPLLVENGYLVTDTLTGTKLYYEPHGNHSPDLNQFAPVDVVITPVVDLAIPLLGPIIKGRETALEVVERLQPRVLIPTAAGGNVKFEGLLVSVLRAQGSPTELQVRLKQSRLNQNTKLITPQPGERLDLRSVLAEATSSIPESSIHPEPR